ncbi:MAG: hypothetical protein CMQ24_03725 [Gammaproteobacteria bacterium]|nr:hypothetical protein [Gammaproteobacteria bacterium]
MIVPRRFAGHYTGTHAALRERPVLLLKPNCKCRDVDPPDQAGASICAFECSFCASCAGVMGGQCLNFGGELVPGRARGAALLGRLPASTERVHAWRSCPDVA